MWTAALETFLTSTLYCMHPVHGYCLFPTILNSILSASFPSSVPSGGEVATPRFTQYFHGSLSGLTIRPGRIETQKVISCLQACKEGLDINSLESLAKDIKVWKNHTHTASNFE